MNTCALLFGQIRLTDTAVQSKPSRRVPSVRSSASRRRLRHTAGRGRRRRCTRALQHEFRLSDGRASRDSQLAWSQCQLSGRFGVRQRLKYARAEPAICDKPDASVTAVFRKKEIVSSDRS
jgi:hypothetical protein